jgi:hypothetical protein
MIAITHLRNKCNVENFIVELNGLIKGVAYLDDVEEEKEEEDDDDLTPFVVD